MIRYKHLLVSLIVCITCVLSGVSAHGQSILYVDDDSAPGGDGAGWSTAYRYLQDALHVATTGVEIRVAGGTYTPDQDKAGNVTAGDRHATFHLISGVAVKGGYAGPGAPDPDE